MGNENSETKILHSLLRSTIATDNLNFLKSLLASGKFEINGFDKNGYSPLMIASRYKAINVAKYLLDLGVDLHYQAPDGKTALDCAKTQELLDVLKFYRGQKEDIVFDEIDKLEWEVEPESKILKQNIKDIEKAKEVFERISTSKIIDDIFDWDGSSFQFPNRLEKPIRVILPKKILVRLANVIYFGRVTPCDLNILENVKVNSTKEPKVTRDELDVALSCTGIITDSREILYDYIYRTEDLLLDEQDDISEFIEIIADARRSKDPLFDIYNLINEIKTKQIESTETLYDEIEKKEIRLSEIVFQSYKALVLLLVQAIKIDKNQKNDKRDLAIKVIGGKSKNFMLENLEGLSSNLHKEYKYSTKKNPFNKTLKFDFSKKVESLIEKIINEKEISNSLERQCTEILKELQPNSSAYEIVMNSLRELGTEKEISDDIEILLSEIQFLRHKIALKNYGLIPYVMKKIFRKGVDYDDLCQEGYIGLYKATERFDRSYGASFSTYAVWWIKQSVVRYRDETFSTIRYPVHFIDNYTKYRQLLKKYEDFNEEEPAPSILAEILDIPENSVRSLSNYYSFISYEENIKTAPEFGLLEDALLFNEMCDESLKNEFTNTFSKVVNYEGIVDQKLLEAVIHEFLEEIPERNRNILISRFGLNGEKPKTLEQIGDVYDITRERVRQIELKILKTFRNTPRIIKRLKQFL